jgi:hypothetical protein
MNMDVDQATIDQMRRMAARALQENPRDPEAAREAFLSYLWRDELLILFAPWIEQATNDCLHPAARAVAASNRNEVQGTTAEMSSSCICFASWKASHHRRAPSSHRTI